MRVLKGRSGRRGGFTLLELIVVLAVLVALAGLAVAKLDLLQLKAEKATAGMDMRNISRLIQTYRATSNFYPNNWDSLLETGATTLRQASAPGATPVQPGLDPGIAGGNGFADPKLAVMAVADALTANDVKSLARLGITTVYDHDGTTTLPYGDKFITLRNIAVGDRLVTINNTPGGAGQKIIRSIYPTPGTPTIPTGRKLVVFGLGKWCTVVGNTDQNAVISEPPTYPYSNDLYYNRYLAVFEIDGGGGRCRLVAVLGADGDLAADELAEFSKS